MKQSSYIQIYPTDNVAIALESLNKGMVITLGGRDIILFEDIPAGHKFTLFPISRGENIIKYGFPIGRVISDLLPGEWVNERNLKTNLNGVEEYCYEPIKEIVLATNDNVPNFLGYQRSNGEVGIRNEIWIIPTVGCVNGVIEELARRMRSEVGEDGVDAIVAFPHNFGCSQLGADHESTREILRNIVLHPNAGAVLVVGLGCENNQLKDFKLLLGSYDPERIAFIECQRCEDELEEGMEILRLLYLKAKQDQRCSIPLSKLRVGLKCGGSDGFSGITANPLLGAFSDYLVALGGTSVLTEVPEMFGAERLLMNRCIDERVFHQTVSLINDFKDYFISNDQPVYENPSPGNKAGGISTLEEKSLGCTQKSGTSLIRGVIAYGKCLQVPGLNLLSAPGNDLVATTALAASGCHLILFTTGRGTPFGTFVPTVKVSTNSALARNKSGWIDFNAGTLVEGEDMVELLERFVGKVVSIASGEFTSNEKKNYRGISIFKTGVTL